MELELNYRGIDDAFDHEGAQIMGRKFLGLTLQRDVLG